MVMVFACVQSAAAGLRLLANNFDASHGFKPVIRILSGRFRSDHESSESDCSLETTPRSSPVPRTAPD